MPKTFKLPDLGEGIHESEVVALHVAVGDHVTEGDIILEVETDKATVEIPSPYTGKVSEILVQIGDVVRVGAEMIRFDDAKDQQIAPSFSDGTKTVVSYANEELLKVPNKTLQQEPIPASPSTRRLARELKVALAQVSPSGPAGLVTAEDVRAFAEKMTSGQSKEDERKSAHVSFTAKPLVADASPLPDFEQYGPVERVPLRSIRRATAKQMTLAWTQIPHVTSQDTIDITELEVFRQKHKNDIAR
ncbi:MAG: E3 binding domain-containing protein, partial [Desulfobacteraceae bacterium]